MKKIILLLLLLSANAFCQKPVYDEALAKSLGGDSHGMKQYVLVILKDGSNTGIDAKQKGEIFRGHMDNIQRLANEGKLYLAGPFGKNDSNYRGIFIFNVATVDEAKALVETDPAIKNKVLAAEFFPWYGTAALGKVNEIHNQIAKEKF